MKPSNHLTKNVLGYKIHLKILFSLKYFFNNSLIFHKIKHHLTINCLPLEGFS